MNTLTRLTTLAASAATLAVGTAMLTSKPASLSASERTAPAAVEITVYKSPTCGCCSKWVDHMTASGFKVTAHDTSDMQSVKKKLGVPDEMASCHTSVVNGYIIEGHVPAADIQRLLDCLNRLVNAGNSVILIEHHLDVIKTSDWVIDLGPDGGKRGGLVIAQGTPEDVAKTPGSHTGRFLSQVL